MSEQEIKLNDKEQVELFKKLIGGITVSLVDGRMVYEKNDVDPMAPVSKNLFKFCNHQNCNRLLIEAYICCICKQKYCDNHIQEGYLFHTGPPRLCHNCILRNISRKSIGYIYEMHLQKQYQTAEKKNNQPALKREMEDHGGWFFDECHPSE